MRIVTPEEMVRIDRWAIEDMGIPDMLLMELAGKGVADIIMKEYPEALYWLIVAGKGNNGGDGYVVGRHLANHGYEVDIIVLGEKSKIKGSARKNLEIAMQMGIPVSFVEQEDDLKNVYSYLDNYDGVVDAIFGTGFKGKPEGIYREAIELINTFPGKVVSLDIPSGVNAETGKVEGVAVRADITCAICLAKTGHFLFPGRDYRGELHVVDIGIPLHRYSGINKVVPNDSFIRMILPVRPPHGHKGFFGKVMVIGGSSGMAGAVSLAALSALKIGAGLSYAAVPASIVRSVDAIAPEVVKIPLYEEDKGFLLESAYKEIEKHIKSVNVVVIGPGMGQNERLKKLVTELVENTDVPMVLDADALNNIAGNWELIEKKETPIVLTPHPGEFARWIESDPHSVDEERLFHVLQFADKYEKHVLVLKGATTLVGSDNRVYFNPTGNDGMATGGSGDVLSGIIAGLIAQGLTPLQASFVGVYIHGKAGDVAAQKKNRYSITAVDIMENIYSAINEIMEVESCS